MDTRTAALRWLKSNHGLSSHGVYCSKYYRSYESWPKREVWWLQIPTKAIEQYKQIHLLCQISPDSTSFRYLKVPTSFLMDHLIDFDRVQDKIHIYLSPEPQDFLTELRGKRGLRFDAFLISDYKSSRKE